MKKFFILLLAIVTTTSVYSQQIYNSLTIKNLFNTSTATFNTSYSGVAKLSSGVLSASSIVDADVSASAALAYSKFASMATGQVLLGNAGVPTATALSGGATVGATGIVTLGNSAVITQILTGYTAGAGTVSSADSILGAIQKIDGNTSAKLGLTKSDTDGAAVATTQLNAPYSQLTTVSGSTRNIETGNKNMFVNGEFEGGTTSSIPNGWTCTTGTCTKTTSAGEFSSGLSAMKIVPTSNALDVSQTVNTASGIQKQGYVEIIYRVPSTCSTSFVIRTLVDGSTQTEVPVSRLIFDDKFHSIQIPTVFGSTSAGVRIFANGTCTGNIFVDGAIVAQGLGLQNLQGDTVYSAKVSNTGVVSDENKEFITTTTATPVSDVYTFTLNAFTIAPNCSVSVVHPSGATSTAIIRSISSTQLVVVTADGGSGGRGFDILCQKTGLDYATSSSQIYSQASADFGPTAAAFTLSNSGNATVTGTVSRKGDMALFKGRVVIGSTLPTGSITLNLPAGYAMANTSRYLFSTVDNSTNNYQGTAYATSSTAINFYGPTSVSAWNATVPITWAALNYFDFNIYVEISGWSNASVIVGSLAQKAPTIQKFTSGSGTYTTPTGVSYIKVKMVGGGGGGGGSGNNGAGGGTGGTGGTTTFGSSLLSAGGGAGGMYGGTGGAGGTGSITAPAYGTALYGGYGGVATGGTLTNNISSPGGNGGSSFFGGGGTGGISTGGAPTAAYSNTGSGGGGAGFANGATLGFPAGGGGAGGYAEALINTPSATYSYAVGAAGTAGTAGTSGAAGGAGGSGYIEVTEFYNIGTY